MSYKSIRGEILFSTKQNAAANIQSADRGCQVKAEL